MKTFEIQVKQDHILKQSKASGVNALAEIIWNALDADATEVKIVANKNGFDNYYSIDIQDNGHGISYDEAIIVFQNLGGSKKSIEQKSPGGRFYHGKEGKGRFKLFSLGNNIIFESIYSKDGKLFQFKIQLSIDNVKQVEIHDAVELNGNSLTGVIVKIDDLNQSKISEIFSELDFRHLHEIFASYYLRYRNFNIKINETTFNFESLIKDTKTHEIKKTIEGNDEKFEIDIIEWRFDNKKKTYLANRDGIPYHEMNLGIRSSLPITMYIKSEFITKCHENGTLILEEMDENIASVLDDAKELCREYVRWKLHLYSADFISSLKKEDIYPFKDEPKGNVETAKRQVFDIVVLQVNDYLPDFTTSDRKNKQFTLTLIKEALEKDSSNLHRILTEVIELPEDKKNDLLELLEKTSLSKIIDTMTDIDNKLKFINGLELLIYDDEYSKNIKERAHLHKILVNETWIFGDEYTYGADDISLKNVLKAYLQNLGRNDFEEIVESEDNSDLKKIPDVCLWKQFKLGKQDCFENMIIELKKPTVDAGFTEKLQIEQYASLVSQDKRFPKEKTKWTFMLITRDYKNEITPLLQQTNRVFGHIVQAEHYDVFIKSWGAVLSEAKTRYQFVKEKLDINLKDNEEAIDFLKTKYHKYLPEKFAENVEEVKE